MSRLLQTTAALALMTNVGLAQQPSESRRIQPIAAASVNSQGTKKALLVGNKNYRAQSLANPINDATDLSTALSRLGFATTLVTDATKSTIQSAAKEFSATLKAGDVGVFYFSGHGFQIDGENYLVPTDFAAANEVAARTQGVKFSEVKTELEQSGASVVLLILDSCRDNPFTAAGSNRKGMALLEAGLGSYVVFAASPGKTASDNPRGRNGLFTQYLLAKLDQAMPITELFRSVRMDVYKASAGQQLPYLHDQIIQDVSLAARAPATPAAADVPQSGSGITDFEQAKQLYQQGRCDQAAVLLDRLVRQAPENVFAQNAAGMAYECLNRNVPALERFSMAIQLKPDYAAAYLNRGDLRLKMAQYELAAADFSWAIEQEPETAVFYARRGRALFGQRRYEDAQRDYSKAIELDPTAAAPYQGRGQVLYQLGKFQDALRDYDAAIARKGDFGVAYSERSRCRDRIGDSAGAVADRALAQHFSSRSR